jgi:hypothetical protein
VSKTLGHSLNALIVGGPPHVGRRRRGVGVVGGVLWAWRGVEGMEFVA